MQDHQGGLPLSLKTLDFGTTANQSTHQALSLDKAGTTAWVLVMANGAVAYSRAGRSPGKLGQTFDHFEFEEFATKNFGCDFGALEQTDGHFFPTSCAAFSEEVSKEEA